MSTAIHTDDRSAAPTSHLTASPAGQAISTAVREQRNRFVAFAFAAADLLLEIDRGGMIEFATGAARGLCDTTPEALTGRQFRELLAAADRPLLRTLCASIANGGRFSPVAVRLGGADGPPVLVGGCCLPEQPGTICISLARAGASLTSDVAGSAGQIADRDTFKAMASGVMQRTPKADRKLTLISIEELDSLQRRLDDEISAGLIAALQRYLRASVPSADAAGEIAPGRYGVLHGGAFDEQQFRENVEGTARRVDPTGKGVRVRAGTLDMSDTGVEGEDAGRALAYCIDRFAEENIEDISAWAMSGALTGQLTETRNRVASFRKAVGAREFDLVYQPIVELKTRQMHHLEALARFADTPSPASTVAFAEAVRLIGEFDLAVCARIVDVLEHAPPGQLPVAVNISGGSLDNAGFRKALRSLARSHAALAPLLMFEITESAAIKRLDYANETIQELRQLGFRVCLDDFGAGANSFHYLRGFAVDFVKIDGAFARAAASNSPRDKSLLRCIAEFCEENRIATIAEMIERESEARSLLELGIGFGQGYLFGRPSPRACAIVSEARPPKATVRRPR